MQYFKPEGESDFYIYTYIFYLPTHTHTHTLFFPDVCLQHMSCVNWKRVTADSQSRRIKTEDVRRARAERRFEGGWAVGGSEVAGCPSATIRIAAALNEPVSPLQGTPASHGPQTAPQNPAALTRSQTRPPPFRQNKSKALIAIAFAVKLSFFHFYILSF